MNSIVTGPCPSRIRWHKARRERRRRIRRVVIEYGTVVLISLAIGLAFGLR